MTRSIADSAEHLLADVAADLLDNLAERMLIAPDADIKRHRGITQPNTGIARKQHSAQSGQGVR